MRYQYKVVIRLDYLFADLFGPAKVGCRLVYVDFRIMDLVSIAPNGFAAKQLIACRLRSRPPPRRE